MFDVLDIRVIEREYYGLLLLPRIVKDEGITDEKVVEKAKKVEEAKRLLAEAEQVLVSGLSSGKERREASEKIKRAKEILDEVISSK
jgi:hypothetical protein